ncbi:MAG: DMT family transporter [Rhodocyclaceae bacterium]|nr:DMT family transporter [Rhodocyclaceae bacterium]MCA3049916.1 DMT family transporter [Rhodocyclaceae bacterium]MCA3054960.1 DMT family transporter [Rhodocyclaceae bacterium]MCA3067688.1 DMT family transporter [Rhodocyclaceae bacterium]
MNPGSLRIPVPSSDALLAWFFVSVWGVGFIATKTGLQYAAPFTFLTLRFCLGIVCLLPVLLWLRPSWPRTKKAWGHVIVAGLLMHAIHLSGSHYGQYEGLSAGVVAIILAAQPLLTAMIAALVLNEAASRRQWLGISIGLIGVLLVVWHKLDIHAMNGKSLTAVLVALIALTVGTLYQRRFLPDTDLWSAAFIQFVASLLLLAPLAIVVESAKVEWAWQLFAAMLFLVVLASILGVSALHILMRHGQATRVSSILYLPPIFAVAAEWLVYCIIPTPLTFVGIVIVCAGVWLAQTTDH